MEVTDNLTGYLAIALAMPLVGLMAMFLELHAQAQPANSWWHDCRQSIHRVGQTSTAISVGLFAMVAVLMWGNA